MSVDVFTVSIEILWGFTRLLLRQQLQQQLVVLAEGGLFEDVNVRHGAGLVLFE